MNNVTQFSFEIAKNLVQSQAQFPIDFDLAWQWLEFSQKISARISFNSADFIEGVDCSGDQYFYSEIEILQKNTKGRKVDKLYLSIDCFKTWAMMVNTSKGKEVRRYFLDCEKLLQKTLKTITYTITTQPNLLAIERSKHYQKQFEELESAKLPKATKNLLTEHLKQELESSLAFTDRSNWDRYRWQDILIHFCQHIEILLERGDVGDWNCRKIKKTDDTGVIRHYLAVIVYRADGGVYPALKDLCSESSESVPYHDVSIKDLAEMLGSGHDYEQFQLRKGSYEWEKKRCVMLPIYTDFSKCILPELREQLLLKPTILR